MTTDNRHQKVQDLAGRITALRKSYRKTPSYFKALQIQKLTRERQRIITELRNEFYLVTPDV
jgi:hypothetical protein